MRLHLGCGKNYLPGWVNIDISNEYKLDLCANVNHLPFEEYSVDLIYASHILEHFGRSECLDILYHWHSILKVGGMLRIAVPNWSSINTYYSKYKRLDLLLGLLYGGQDCEYNYHNMVFDFETLKAYLNIIGFHDVVEYDWRETDHAQYDDFSQAYLPHLNKDYGLHMSLNVEAIK